MELNRIDLNLLIAFDVLMTERNLTRAAHAMSVGQPAMSATLNRLRKVFDDPLLVRDGAVWVPTSVAESLAQPIHEALQSLETTLASRRAFEPKAVHRTFNVMASDYVTIVLLKPLILRLAEEAPHVRLTVVPIETTFENRLRHGEVDLAVFPREGTSDHKALASADLYVDRYVCAVGEDNEEVGDRLTLETFLSLPYLAFGGMNVRSIAEVQLEHMGIDRPVDITMQSFVVGPLFLQGTRFVTLIHERLAEAVAEKLSLRILDSPIPLKTLTMAMFWNPRRSGDPGHKWLRAKLLEVAMRDSEAN